MQIAQDFLQFKRAMAGVISDEYLNCLTLGEYRTLYADALAQLASREQPEQALTDAERQQAGQWLHELLGMPAPQWESEQ